MDKVGDLAKLLTDFPRLLRLLTYCALAVAPALVLAPIFFDYPFLDALVKYVQAYLPLVQVVSALYGALGFVGGLCVFVSNRVEDILARISHTTRSEGSALIEYIRRTYELPFGYGLVWYAISTVLRFALDWSASNRGKLTLTTCPDFWERLDFWGLLVAFLVVAVLLVARRPTSE